MPKINMRLSIGFPGAEHTMTVNVSQEEWDSMDESGKESFIDSCEQEFLQDHAYVTTKIEED